MLISKRDALNWFSFFAEMQQQGEELSPRQTEIAYSGLYQLECAVERKFSLQEAEIPGLKSLDGRTKYVGDFARFPKGCIGCLCGTGLGAIRKTNKCDASCRFCYDFGVLDQIPPIGEGMWEIGGTRFREDDVDLLLSICNRPSGVAYVYLEPFMEIEKYYSMIARFAKAGIYQHLYTNGIHATEAQLKALGDAGLNELRFNLGASGCSDKVINLMRDAKKYIPMVGIETPMTREFFAAFEKKKAAILGAGPDFLNLAELHLNPNNLANYLGESMYMYRHGYLSPIFSRELSLKLMKTAAIEGWGTLVHDCSNRTKFARDLNQSAKEGGWFGRSTYGSEFDSIPFEALLPALEDEALPFVAEEPLPKGYRPEDIVI
ncbi:MAG: radical SAM protein [Clostridiales bacterium]|nr:radical SAM protein [Clostridiales bacterium]